jgi:hypothetical protein
MTQNGSLDTQDVQEKFDELQSWEKKQFLLENIDILDEDDYDTYIEWNTGHTMQDIINISNGEEN